MQAFDELWWDLDQVVAWAETREREALEYAAFGVGGLRLPPSTQKIADWIRQTASRMRARDINAELWARQMAFADRGAINPGEVLQGTLARPELPEAAALVAAYSLAEENDTFFLSLILMDRPGSRMSKTSLDLTQRWRTYRRRCESSFAPIAPVPNGGRGKAVDRFKSSLQQRSFSGSSAKDD